MEEDFLDGATPELHTRIEIWLLYFDREIVLFFSLKTLSVSGFSASSCLLICLFVCGFLTSTKLKKKPGKYSSFKPHNKREVLDQTSVISFIVEKWCVFAICVTLLCSPRAFSPSFHSFSGRVWASVRGAQRAVAARQSLSEWLQQTPQLGEWLQHFHLNHFNYLPSIFRLSKIPTLSTPSTHKLEQLSCNTCLELACYPSLDP